jgi:hypothetical protein
MCVRAHARVYTHTHACKQPVTLLRFERNSNDTITFVRIRQFVISEEEQTRPAVLCLLRAVRWVGWRGGRDVPCTAFASCRVCKVCISNLKYSNTVQPLRKFLMCSESCLPLDWKDCTLRDAVLTAPTNQKAKGRVRRRRETSFAARLDHFCVRNSKQCLGLQQGMGSDLHRGRRPWHIQTRAVAAGGRWYHQATCPLTKELYLHGCLGIEPLRVGVILAEGLFSWVSQELLRQYISWRLSRLSFKTQPLLRMNNFSQPSVCRRVFQVVELRGSPR